MPVPDYSLLLRCTACNWSQALDEPGLVRWLAGHGQLRERTDTKGAMLRELALALVPGHACPRCAHVGLSAQLEDTDALDWPTARRCEGCGGLIGELRLEVFPDARMCKPCQEQLDCGESPSTGEFCPRCGAAMIVRPSRGRGIRRYVLECSARPACR